VSEPLSEALLSALAPALRELVRAEVKKADFEWRWRTAEQAAELLDITPEAVRARVRRGSLPGKTLAGRVFVDLRELDRRLESVR